MSIGLNKGAFLFYTLMTGAAFLFFTNSTVSDMQQQHWPQLKKGTPAWRIATTYAEVAGAFNFMLAATTCPGPRGYLLAMGTLVGMMTKHMLVDDLMPPPPVIVLGVGGFVVAAYAFFNDNKWGKWAFLANNAVNAAAFLFMPLTPLRDSFPDSNGLGLVIGLLFMEVIGYHCVMCLLTCCPGDLGRAMAMTAGIVLMAKHNYVDNVGPPMPVAVMMCAATAACWYGHLTSKGGKSKSA